MATIKEFIREYTRALQEGYAAVFAGAGLSRASGFVNWKELVRPLAEDISLDVDRENDLVAVAQYYKNEHMSRSGINQLILNKFTRDVQINENIRLLTKFPVSTYWTTNYDSLLEEGLRENNRKADVKINQSNLASNIYDRDGVVYKMHGDAMQPENAVLTKDDYETYGIKNSLFRTVLQGDLLSKTFLFIGFSFDDPNLEYILSQIRILLDESTREHYCFFEKVKRQDGETPEDFQYRVCQQEFRIKDLHRYGIQAVLLDSYSEITDILKKVDRCVLSRNIFISGSISEYDSLWTEETVNRFAYNLAHKLVHQGYRIISGFGLGIGTSIINGALDEIMDTKYKHVDEHLCMRPFPQYAPKGASLTELWRKYRENMLSESGISIFMFGNKYVKPDDSTESKVVVANGMLQEFEIAKNNSNIIIPLGGTGWAAKQIFDEIEKDIDHYSYLKSHLDILRSSTNPDDLIETICKIIEGHQLK